MDTPFTLSALGYKPDPTNPLRYIHPDGHPYHPIEFKDELSKTNGDCIRAIALAAFEHGKSWPTPERVTACIVGGGFTTTPGAGAAVPSLLPLASGFVPGGPIGCLPTGIVFRGNHPGSGVRMDIKGEPLCKIADTGGKHPGGPWECRKCGKGPCAMDNMREEKKS